jgi:hypothetical protein
MKLTLKIMKERKELLRVARLVFLLDAANECPNYFVAELGRTLAEYEEACEKYWYIHDRPGHVVMALWDTCFPDAP